MKITDKQQEILNEILNNRKSIKDIAQERKVSVQAIYKGITQLKKKNIYLGIGRFKRRHTPSLPVETPPSYLSTS
jgi:transposase-like protein